MFLIIAVVVMAVLPDLVHFLTVKHVAVTPETVRLLPARTRLSSVVSRLAAVAVFLVCSVAVLKRGHPERNVFGVIALLLALIIPYIISPSLPGTADVFRVALAAAVILAIWNIGAPVDGLRWVSITGSIIAAYSIIGGVIIPEYMMYGDRSTKALFRNWQLVGPFGHSNVFGLYCVLALALSPLIVSVPWRIINGLILCAAIVASASRTALIAAGVLALWWIICRFRSVISIRSAGTALIGLCAAVVVVLPLLSWKPQSFTGRGFIWTASLKAWKESPVFGLGINWFETTATPAPYFARWAYLAEAHNLVLDTLVRSGLVGMCLVVLVLLAAIRSVRTLDVSSHQIACFGFLIAFLVESTTEADFILLPNRQQFPVVGLVFAVLISRRLVSRPPAAPLLHFLEQPFSQGPSRRRPVRRFAPVSICDGPAEPARSATSRRTRFRASLR